MEGDARSFCPHGNYEYVIHSAAEASAKLNVEQPELMYNTIVEETPRFGSLRCFELKQGLWVNLDFNLGLFYKDSMKSTLVIGASGQIGEAIMRILPNDWNVVGTYNTKPIQNLVHLDVSNRDEVFKVFEEVKPIVAILSAAFTNVDLCEIERAKANAININGANNICEACREYRAKMVYISTDYVFDGKNGPYREEDAPAPINYYGWTKLEGERITTLNQDHIIIRTTGVYNANLDSMNFVAQVLRKIKAGETMRIPNDQIGSPIFADNLAEGIISLVELDKRGVYNVSGSDLIDRYSFALLIADVFGLNKKQIQAIDTPSLGQKAMRPLKAGLIVEKIVRETGIRMLGAKEGLVKAKEAINKKAKLAGMG